MTIYIVTGDGPRCGSTMMMRALEAGGLEISYDVACDAAVGGEICELPLDVQLEEGFPGPEYDGKALKVWCAPWGPLTHFIPGEYRVIWMCRPAESRWRSVAEFHSKSPMGMMVDGGFAQVALLKDMAVQAGKFAVECREDMEVVSFNYEDVLENPFETFDILHWPIDALKASRIVDSSRRNF